MNFPGLLSWSSVDAVVASLLWPITIWILFSGFDDFFVDLVALLSALRGRARSERPSRRALLSQTQQPIAIMVPLWHEDAVIARMVQQNTASILYRNYQIFIGAYPNDEPTLREIRILEARYKHVHLCICPHEGPTSKADCLNWIFQNLIAYEEASGTQFRIIVTHDAEDVIHSDSLHWINHYSRRYQMVQVPVLPLRTPLTEWVHGVYIDEFSEYQARDMPARQAMGAFVPSQGVGTGFRRDALDALASDSNRIFEPVCLTEDYENGLRLRLHGAGQVFVPLQHEGMATREYFPSTVRAAIRQRTRWVTGIAFQTWERHGWTGGLVQKYWLWRDRKGILGNPISLLTNGLFVYGAIRWFCGSPIPDVPLLKAGAIFGGYRLFYRMVCVGRLFGLGFALTAPPRVVIANYINSAATFCALLRFLSAKWKGLPLIWIKTQHAYPRQEALVRRTMRLGELLVANGYLEQSDVDHALESRPSDVRLGEHLVAIGRLDEESLYEALSLQQALPQSRIEPSNVNRIVTRSLPAKVASRYRLIPFRLDVGRLFVAGPEMPTPQLREELRRFTRLEIEFHLVTTRNYRELAKEFLRA